MDLDTPYRTALETLLKERWGDRPDWNETFTPAVRLTEVIRDSLEPDRFTTFLRCALQAFRRYRGGGIVAALPYITHLSRPMEAAFGERLDAPLQWAAQITQTICWGLGDETFETFLECARQAHLTGQPRRDREAALSPAP